MIRVLIVDDSAFMRKAISMLLEDDPEIEIAGTASDGAEALEKIKELKPDLVTLDIEMPRMDGLTALKHIMREHPLPVLMVSSLTSEGAQATLEAMHAGAIDFIAKESSYASLDFAGLKASLRDKIKAITRSRGPLFRASPPQRPPSLPAGSGTVRAPHAQVVVVGVSTGGPVSLQKVIPGLPSSFPIPVVVVQHMPPHFTRSLADRLNGLSELTVCEAEAGMVPARGHVYIAQGGKHLAFARRGAHVYFDMPDGPEPDLHRPSVDVLFTSARQVFGRRVLAVMMTGMGRDGLEGTRQLKEAGAQVIAQNEETCVVYGMPKVIVEAGLADAALPLEGLSPAIVAAVEPRPSAHAYSASRVKV